MTQQAAEMLDVAERFFTAVLAGDLDTVRAIYASDAVIWHNTDGKGQTVDENLRVLGWIAANAREFAYSDVRRTATDTGFVSQHVTHIMLPDGRSFEFPACIVCRVRDGRITRLDEYFDSAQSPSA